MGLWKKWLTITLSYLSGSSILELGFGPGHLQELMSENGMVGVGLDESRQMTYLARGRLIEAGHTPKLVQAIGEAIPFHEGAFDQVVTTFPAEFITHPDTLKDIHRVLKQDGELIILRFAWLSDRLWPYMLMSWLFRLVGEAPNKKHPIQLDRLSAPFQKAGFSVKFEHVDLDSSGMILLMCKKNDGASTFHT